MTDDRARDRRIAEALDPDHQRGFWRLSCLQSGLDPVNFSSDWSACGALLEELARRGWAPAVYAEPGLEDHGAWVCELSRKGVRAMEGAKTGPEAVARAAEEALCTSDSGAKG